MPHTRTYSMRAPQRLDPAGSLRRLSSSCSPPNSRPESSRQSGWAQESAPHPWRRLNPPSSPPSAPKWHSRAGQSPSRYRLHRCIQSRYPPRQRRAHPGGTAFRRRRIPGHLRARTRRQETCLPPARGLRNRRRRWGRAPYREPDPPGWWHRCIRRRGSCTAGHPVQNRGRSSSRPVSQVSAWNSRRGRSCLAHPRPNLPQYPPRGCRDRR